MPAAPLAPFVVYLQSNFHIGGNPARVEEVGAQWVNFAAHAKTAAVNLRSINDGGFEGSEGDRYKDLINADFPSNLSITSEAHGGVGHAINSYGIAHTTAVGEMGALIPIAGGAHANHQAAVTEFNIAEANAARAAVVSAAATGTAVATAVVPGVNAATASTAATAHADSLAAQTALEAARAHLAEAKLAWEAVIADSDKIKEILGIAVDGAVNAISSQTRKRFQENPNFLQEAVEEISDWVHENADVLKVISDALQIIGGIMMFIPGLNVIGAVLVGIGVGLKMLLAANGDVSWGEALFDLATCGALGAVGKLAKAGKLGNTALKGANAASKAGEIASKPLKAVKSGANAAAMKTADAMSKVGGEAGQKLANKAYGKVTRGGQICFGAEPVDMATGNLVDYETDVYIDGLLPLVIDRNSSSSHEMGRALGPRWISRMDTHIQILTDEILMLSPDGALLTFPSAPTDGTEVVADARPWRLSFADGAYRVRDIPAGLTYVFAVSGDSDSRKTQGSVPDQVITGSSVGVGIGVGSVAEQIDLGIEVGLSSLIHHTGAWIEYDYELSTGHMVAMRRSDGTTLSLIWDGHTNRVASVWVSNKETHPTDEPMRLISYEYDARGQLIRVINSNAGSLRYHYDDQGRQCGWTDRNGVSYWYRFDERGRVVTQVGTGGMFPNALIWLDDSGADAPIGGSVCVLVETAGTFAGDPLTIGDSVVEEYLDRIEELPLVKALRQGGLTEAGLTGAGRDRARSEAADINADPSFEWTLPQEWLHDEVLGDVRPTVYRSEISGDVWRIVSPTGAIIDRGYNQYHQVVEETSPSGVTSTILHDEFGNVVQRNFGDGSSTLIEPAAWGMPAQTIGRDGLATQFEVNDAGLVESVTAPSGETVSYEYEWRPSGVVPSAVIDPAGLVTQFECDGAGRNLAVTDPAGRRSTYFRDARGLVTSSIDPVGEETKISYSPEGWPTQIEYPDGSMVQASFDGEGNQTSVTNEIGAVTNTRFTVFDKPLETIDPSNNVTRLEYNTQMEPITVINADGFQWSFVHDLDGRVVREVDYNGLVRTTEYSADGRLLVEGDGAGKTTHEFDPFGNLVRTDSKDGTTNYLRDTLGRINSIANAGVTVHFQRDEFGRHLGESTVLASGEQLSSKSGVDDFGRLSSMHFELEAGVQLDQEYSRAATGDINGIQLAVNLRELATLTTGVDSAGRRDSLKVGNLQRKLTYDSRSRLESDTLATDGLVSNRNVSESKYHWREDSSLISVDDLRTGQTVFDVDVMGHVTGVKRNRDKVSDLLSDQSTTDKEKYSYSAAGRLTQVSTEGAASTGTFTFQNTLPTSIGRTHLSYDDAGRVVRSTTKRIGRPALTRNWFYGAGSQPIGFEDSDHKGIGFKYLYDGLGRRVAKECRSTSNGDLIARVIFLHDGDVLLGQQLSSVNPDPQYAQIVGELAGAAGLAAESGAASFWPTDATGERLGQIDVRAGANAALEWNKARIDAEFYALVSDMAGAPQALVDPETADNIAYATYTLYGVRQWHGSTVCPLLFDGQYADGESGWAYNRFRFYSPDLGVYGAQDPLGLSPNLGWAQGYVAHPGCMVDFFGLFAHSVKAPPFVHTAHNKGVVGEQAVDNILKRNGGSGIGSRVRYQDAAGNLRISDGAMESGALIEVKNRKAVHLDEQMIAARDESIEAGGPLELWVARETHVPSTIKNDPNINVNRIPRADIVQASKDVWHSASLKMLTY